MQNPRLKAMVVPREHGAWGMLLIPLATGGVVAAGSAVKIGPLALFVVAALSLFWLRTPVEAWLGTSPIKAQAQPERSTVARVSVFLGAVAALAITVLFFEGYARGLLIIGVVVALAFTTQAVVKKLGRRGRMPAQVIGAIGLTSTAVGAYYVATGELDRTAIALWLANWLFAGDQVHFVQVCIRSSRVATVKARLHRGFAFLAGQIVLLGVVIVLCRLNVFPKLVVLAFVPVLLRGTIWFLRQHQPLDVHKLGFSELAQAVIFGALLCAAFLI
jgi:YwiC-like protein